eukprot:Skav219915  [mRNA]  locus=scaffold2006:20371:21999:+ [translate_table: standard]
MPENFWESKMVPARPVIPTSTKLQKNQMSTPRMMPEHRTKSSSTKIRFLPSSSWGSVDFKGKVTNMPTPARERKMVDNVAKVGPLQTSNLIWP